MPADDDFKRWLETIPIEKYSFNELLAHPVTSKRRMALLRNQCFSDVTLQCNGHVIKCHRAFLAENSEVFETMFTSNFKEGLSDEPIEIKAVMYELLMKIINFLYSGEIEIEAQEVMELLEFADMYSVNPLRVVCGKMFCKHATPLIAMTVWKYAKQYRARRLQIEMKSYCLKNFTQDNLPLIAQSAGFLESDSEVIFELLSHPSLNVPNEYQEALKFLGGLDHLVLNHALLQFPECSGSGWSGTEEQLENIEDQFDTGLLSYVHLTAHALPYLRQSAAGKISITGSIFGKTSLRCAPSYASVKFGLDGFYSSLRELFEHDGTNITVTYHVIGPVEVERKIPPTPRALLDLERMSFLLSFGEVESTADAVIQATTRGDAELYYPHLFGFIREGYRLFPIFRHILHNFSAPT